MNHSHLSRKFDKQAMLYKMERKIKVLAPWRRKLISEAKGNVLELAVGAGGNFPFYQPDVNVTAGDISPKMLKKAEDAAREEHLEATFILGNNETLLFPENSFDTIVSTLSFCGYEKPSEMLAKLNHWCKPDGKILLLEHGVSISPLLARFQQLIDPIHVRFIGCHQSREINHLIQSSALEVTKSETHFEGIFHLIWAKPGRRSKIESWNKTLNEKRK